MKHFEAEGIKVLEEIRGEANGPVESTRKGGLDTEMNEYLFKFVVALKV